MAQYIKACEATKLDKDDFKKELIECNTRKCASSWSEIYIYAGTAFLLGIIAGYSVGASHGH